LHTEDRQVPLIESFVRRRGSALPERFNSERISKSEFRLMWGSEFRSGERILKNM